MKSEEIEILLDIKGFIDWSITHNETYHWVLLNIVHDINGIINNSLCFVPRTKGYKEYMQ